MLPKKYLTGLDKILQGPKPYPAWEHQSGCFLVNFTVLKLCNALRKAAFYLHQPIYLKSQVLAPVVLGDAQSREEAEEF